MTSGSRPDRGAQQRSLIDAVVICFDAYARVRGRRHSLLNAAHAGEREEQRAYEDLQRAVTRLRNSTET
ncbi:hypothetical protein [Streptomyces zhihengii]